MSLTCKHASLMSAYIEGGSLSIMRCHGEYDEKSCGVVSLPNVLVNYSSISSSKRMRLKTLRLETPCLPESKVALRNDTMTDSS